MKKRTLLSWSSGKESALVPHLLQSHSRDRTVQHSYGDEQEVQPRNNRASIHVTRLKLLKKRPIIKRDGFAYAVVIHDSLLIINFLVSSHE